MFESTHSRSLTLYFVEYLSVSMSHWYHTSLKTADIVSNMQPNISLLLKVNTNKCVNRTLEWAVIAVIASHEKTFFDSRSDTDVNSKSRGEKSSYFLALNQA